LCRDRWIVSARYFGDRLQGVAIPIFLPSFGPRLGKGEGTPEGEVLELRAKFYRRCPIYGTEVRRAGGTS
jgi:hypothetical protein